MTRLNLLETLSNNKVQDILEEMGMLENGNCPYTAEEIFKAGVEYAQNHIESNEKNIFENAYLGKVYKTDKGDKACYQKFAKTYYIEGIKECAAFPNVHILFTSNDIILADNNGIAQNLNSFNNIVSEWEEDIDENYLNKLSKEYSLWLADEPLQEQRYIDGFKEGYKAAKKGE